MDEGDNRAAGNMPEREEEKDADRKSGCFMKVARLTANRDGRIQGLRCGTAHGIITAQLVVFVSCYRWATAASCLGHADAGLPFRQ